MDKTAFLRWGDFGDPRVRHELVKISYDNHLLRANKTTHLIKCKVNIAPCRTQNNPKFIKRLSIRIRKFTLRKSLCTILSFETLFILSPPPSMPLPHSLFQALILPFNNLIRAVALPGILSYNYSLAFLLVDETLIMSPLRESKWNCFWPNKASLRA